MKMLDEERAWQGLAVAAAAAAGIGARQLMRNGWKLWRSDEPPENPAARSVSWGDALIWTAVTGITVGLTRLVAERGAAAAWKKAKGHYPRGLE